MDSIIQEIARLTTTSPEDVTEEIRTIDEAFDARCAIELGVAEMTVGRVSEDDLAELHERLEIMKPLIAEDRFVDFGRYLEANNDYHECLVGLAKNDALLSAYKNLGMKTLMARALGVSERSSNRVIADHVRLTEAYERGDLEGATDAIRDHAELAKQRARLAAVEAAGGRG